MDLEERARRGPQLGGRSARGLAVAAFVIEIAIIVIPWSPAGSFLSVAIAGPYSIAIKLANLLQLLAGAFVIAGGVWAIRSHRADFAAGMFVAAAVVLAIHVVSGLLTATEGWVWQTFAILGLQAIEAGLLLLAASSARREGSASAA
jgi:hypothetical protein